MAGRRTQGQSAGLTRDAVLRAAVVLADREGLKALSMRRLGAELGVEAMTLYHHLPSKDALLDGLVEQLVAPVAPPDFATSWQESLRTYAVELRAALLAHPNLVPLVASRPAVTAQNLRVMETALKGLGVAGFDPADALDVLYAVTGFVVGHVVTASDGDPVDHLEAIDATEFPLLAAAASAVPARTSGARFGLALDALLKGLDAAR